MLCFVSDFVRIFVFGFFVCLGFLLFFLSTLTLVAEWKEMVARLILMSYKLSAVVSPVVQSSSPEGLIPMDSDSGKQTKP